jgi:hypothetical protein
MAIIKKKDSKPTLDFALGKQNYILLVVGVLFIALGFILMAGGGSTDPNVFSQDIFSFRRITVAPILILIGFVIEVYAIMKRPKEEDTK